MTELPDITEVQRVAYKPGDRFILRVSEPVGRDEATEITAQFRRLMDLPAGVPVIVVPAWIEVSVAAPEDPGDPDDAVR